MEKSKKVKILVFDTETAGLPKHYKPAEEDLDNYPSALQLGAQLIEVDLDNPLQSFDNLSTGSLFKYLQYKSSKLEGSCLRGRPNLTPFCFAAAIPSACRCLIQILSCSA